MVDGGSKPLIWTVDQLYELDKEHRLFNLFQTIYLFSIELGGKSELILQNVRINCT